MKKGYIFDLDGTVYLGDKVIEGAAETIHLLKERGDQVVFLSNNPTKDPKMYAEKLTKLGLPTPENGDRQHHRYHDAVASPELP
jgi:arabinose operon protein AraL